MLHGLVTKKIRFMSRKMSVVHILQSPSHEEPHLKPIEFNREPINFTLDLKTKKTWLYWRREEMQRPNEPSNLWCYSVEVVGIVWVLNLVPEF